MAIVLLLVILAHFLGGSGRQAQEDANRMKKIKSVQGDLKIMLSMGQVLQPGVCAMLSSGVWWNHVGNTMFISCLFYVYVYFPRLQLVGSSLQITIPPPFAEMARSFGFLTFNFLDLEIVPLACLLQLDFRHKFAMYCAIPVVLMLVIKMVGYSVARGGAAKENLEAAFLEADADKNGSLDAEEVGVLVRTLHLVGAWMSMALYTVTLGVI